MDRDDKILAYLQGKLASSDLARFEMDMAKDKALAAEVGVMRSVRAELSKAPKLPDPDEGWDRLSAAITETVQPANDNRAPWRQMVKYAAVACVAIAAWQVVAVPRLGNGPVSEPFRAASEVAEAFTLQVRFTDTATIADIAALLAPLNGSISEGPSALGIVRLSFEDDVLRGQARIALEARTDLVEFALEQ